jgi:hypothetical protein
MLLRKSTTAFALLLALTLAPAAASKPAPSRDILGLHLNITKDEARRRLRRLGRLQREERRRQEVWELNDPRFSHVVVGFDKAERVRFVTAFSRPGAKVRYDEVADLKRARQAGDVKINLYHYVWELAARRGSPHAEVAARGRDPHYLESYSIKRLN